MRPLIAAFPRPLPPIAHPVRLASALSLPLTGAALGLLAFAGPWQCLGLAAALLPLLSLTKSRAEAFSVSLAYQLAASRGLIAGSALYFETTWTLGAAIWILGNTVSASLYAIAWHKRLAPRVVSMIASMTLLALPPFGALGWASPLSAAGVFYPGLGLWGLVLIVALMTTASLRRWPIAAALLAVSLGANLLPHPVQSRLEGLTTTYGPPPTDFAADYQRQIDLAIAIRASTGDTVALPEGSLLAWNEVSRRLWQRILPPGRAIILGATLPASSEHKQQNALIVLTNTSSQLYRQRQPVPMSMWRPWSTDGYEEAWSAPPIIVAAGVKIAPLLCYEAFLVWPSVQSLAAGGEELVVAANLWWAKGTSVPALQKSLATSWSRLFSVPLTMAVNT